MALKITTKNTPKEPTSIIDPSAVIPILEKDLLKLELVEENDPILKEYCIPFDFKNPQMSPEVLFLSMKNKLIEQGGLGLSAPQVGLPYRMFVMGVVDDPDNIVGVFNPVITVETDQTEWMVEGCLSYPDLFIKVKRPYAIRVRYTVWQGKTDTIKFEGLSARMFQHEFSHLNGRTFLDDSTLYHRKKAIKDRKLIRRKRKKSKL